MNHSTLQFWVFKFTPMIDSQMKNRKSRVGVSWRMDGTYIKVKGIWCYFYRAFDKSGNTVDFLLKEKDRESAQSFLIKTIRNYCIPTVMNIDKSGSNTSAIRVYNKLSFFEYKDSAM